MPITYNLITSSVLTVTTTSVTFSSIPQTYTDLLLKISARTPSAGTNALVLITPNGTSLPSYTRLRGDGSSVAASRASGGAFMYAGLQNASGATANVFGSLEWYMSNYTSTSNKSFYSFAAQETNATLAYIESYAGLERQTNAITSMTINEGTFADGFVSGSSFYLYGIKNS